MGAAKDKRRIWEVSCLMNELVTKPALSCFVVRNPPWSTARSYWNC